MSAAYRSSTITSTGATAAGSLIIAMPAGVQSNDCLIAAISVDGGTGAAVTPPSGWSTISNTTQSTNSRLVVYIRIATGYEAASYTWTFDASRMAVGTIAAYSGTYTFSPYGFSTATTTSASTSITTSAPNSSYETGLGFQIVATRNATAITTITSGAGYTKRNEGSTSAAQFMGVALQDTPKALPMGGVGTGSGTTSSQAATAITTTVFIEDARPPFSILAEDEFNVGSITSGSFTVSNPAVVSNYPNTVFLAFLAINKDVATVSSIVTSGLTWQLVARANTNAGSSEIWRALASTPINTGMTVNYSASIGSVNNLVVGLVGCDLTGSNGSGAIGAVATGTTTTSAANIALTTTRANSWVWAMGNQATASAPTMMAGASQTILRASNDATNACSSLMWRQNSLTTTSGTVVTMSTTVPTTDSFNVAAVEIIPAAVKNLGTLGVG